MSKTTEQKAKFIELRGRGFSYDKITQEVEVSKSTLVKWSYEYSREIEEAQALEFQSLLAQYSIMRKSRVESLSSLLHACLEELKSRECKLESLSTEKLLAMVLQLEKRLQEESKVQVMNTDFSMNMFYETVFLD